MRSVTISVVTQTPPPTGPPEAGLAPESGFSQWLTAFSDARQGGIFYASNRPVLVDMFLAALIGLSLQRSDPLGDRSLLPHDLT